MSELNPREPGFDTATIRGRVAARAYALAPEAYAGCYEDERGVLIVAFTHDAPKVMARLRREFPKVPMRDRNARHSMKRLLAVLEELQNELVDSDEWLSIGEEGLGRWSNTVGVGLVDPNGELAWRLKQKYGTAIRVHRGREIEEL